MEAIETIITEECDGNILLVRYNQPKKKNAMDLNMYRKVTDILNAASKNEDVNAVVLTGTGNFYSSGNDLTAHKNYNGDYDLFPALKDFIRAFIEFPKILVAIVNGPAIGIAATTLALCDLVFASENSYFYTPFTKLGIVAEGCSTFTFSRILGERKALEMLLFNYKMPASEALERGFVNDIYKPEELQNKVWNKIVEMTKLNNNSVMACKKLIRDQYKEHLLQLNDSELEVVQKMQQRSKL